MLASNNFFIILFQFLLPESDMWEMENNFFPLFFSKTKRRHIVSPFYALIVFTALAITRHRLTIVCSVI